MTNSSARPDKTPSEVPEEGASSFSETEYQALRKRYLEKRVRTGKDAALPDGIHLRRKTVQPAILNPSPGYKALKKLIDKLETKKDHQEIFRLLYTLAEWEKSVNRPFPIVADEELDSDEEKPLALIDLTDDQEVIDVDTYILEVLLVKVVKAEPMDDEDTNTDVPTQVATATNNVKQEEIARSPNKEGDDEELKLPATQSSDENETVQEETDSIRKETPEKASLADSTRPMKSTTNSTESVQEEAVASPKNKKKEEIAGQCCSCYRRVLYGQEHYKCGHFISMYGDFREDDSYREISLAPSKQTKKRCANVICMPCQIFHDGGVGITHGTLVVPGSIFIGCCCANDDSRDCGMFCSPCRNKSQRICSKCGRPFCAVCFSEKEGKRTLVCRACSYEC